MTKLYLTLADTHFGVRQDSDAFHNNNRRFFETVFFPIVDKLSKEHELKVIHVGDVFDNRRKIDIKTLKYATSYFFDPLAERKIKMDVIAGNHDLYWREKSDTSTLHEVIDWYDNITYYTEGAEVGDFIYIPWINNQTGQATMKMIDKSSKRFAFGHLELVGFQLHRGRWSTHGQDPKIFSKFNHVYSGHFHHKQTTGNITYLGSNQQHTWMDCGDRRGFHIFDGVEMRFIANPHDMFYITQYGEQFDPQGKYVRVRYSPDVKQSDLDQYIKQLQNADPVDVQSIPDRIISEQSATNDSTNLDVEDTQSLIRSMVSEQPVFDKMVDLYNEALLLEK